MENPELFEGAYYRTQFTPEKRHSDTKTADNFAIEDLLDLPNDDVSVTDATTFAGTSTESSALTVVDSCNSSFSGNETCFAGGDIGSRSFIDGQFAGDLCVPNDERAELEWLSTFVEDSFSCEDLQKLHLISGIKTRPDSSSGNVHQIQPEPTRNAPTLPSEMSVPAKARSKRSRAVPCNWTTRLLAVSPTQTMPQQPPTAALAMESDVDLNSGKKPVIKPGPKKKETTPTHIAAAENGGEGRRCLHCATDKTPQWRTGPMGPKTLCNACGVRYKSGRLVPEYRPAASPTFVLTKHSNSHRKVLELRRQKEMIRAHQHQQQHQQQFLHHHHQNMMFDVSNGEDYLIHQHVGPDYRQLI